MQVGSDDQADPRAGDPAQPQRRMVCLGASNVTRGLSMLVGTTEVMWSEPLDLMIAAGHGRSYGMTSSVLGRRLPGILQCGLWDQLAERLPLPTLGLVTDIGNDLVYAAGSVRTAEWVEECLRRLSRVCERIVITRLPTDSLARVGPKRFGIMRRMLFPGSRLTLEELRIQVDDLDRRIQQLAERYHAVPCAQPGDWFAWDPIHVRRRCMAAAWHTYASSLSFSDDVPFARGSLRRFVSLRRQRPLSRRWFGIQQDRAQPCCVLRTGTRLSLY
jgi:hypothetical protein